MKLPGHPQACRRLRLPSTRRSRAVPAAGQRHAVAFALPEQTGGGYEGHLRFPLTPYATRPPIFFMAEAGRELGRGVLPVPPLLSQRACPGSYACNPRHEVRQVLPVPGLLELALHGSGCPEQLPALLPVPPPAAKFGVCTATVPAAGLPPRAAGRWQQGRAMLSLQSPEINTGGLSSWEKVPRGDKG